MCYSISDDYITLSGVFYLTLVSPNPLFMISTEYITKQIASQQIDISFIRSSNLINSATVQLWGIYIISADYDRDYDIFEVTIMTYRKQKNKK